MNLHYSILAFTKSSVEFVKEFEIGIKLNSLSFKLSRIFAYMSDFRLGIGAPREDNLRLIILPIEQSISHYVSSMDVGVVSKLISRAAVTNREDIFIGSSEIVVNNHTFL